MPITTIIMGDIANSRQFHDKDLMMKSLRNALGTVGKELTNWIVFSGDSFVYDFNTKCVYVDSCIEKIRITTERMGMKIVMVSKTGDRTFEGKHPGEHQGAHYVKAAKDLKDMKKLLKLKKKFRQKD